jgi:hypothetical protein
MSNPIFILPVGDGEFHTIASIEARAFDSDPITVYAFGPNSIGSMLVREGLEIVDEKRLPVWLGATAVAYPLYKWVGLEVDRARIATSRIIIYPPHLPSSTPQSHLEHLNPRPSKIRNALYLHHPNHYLKSFTTTALLSRVKDDNWHRARKPYRPGRHVLSRRSLLRRHAGYDTSSCASATKRHSCVVSFCRTPKNCRRLFSSLASLPPIFSCSHQVRHNSRRATNPHRLRAT